MAPATTAGGHHAGEQAKDYARAEACVASIFDKDYQKTDKVRNSTCIAYPAMI